MDDKDDAPEFSELVMLYCKHFDVVKTLEQRWKAESDSLAQRVEDRLSDYEDEWEIHFSNTYGWIRKREWHSAGIEIGCFFGFGPEKVGKGALEVSVQVKDKDLRKLICEELGAELESTFRNKPNPKYEYIFRDADQDVGDRSYEDAVVEGARKYIEFSPHLEKYVPDK